ncbi:hypothetical protein AAF712_002633 [Marasmius tenuissimus]|uniref:Uncharacterized protein n=1 Tax=Marasmius tenuissimus TaxID=585030 RepID=A0ABR3A9X4_9AGAR
MPPQTEGTSSLAVFLTTAAVTVLSWFFLFPNIPTFNLNIPFLFKASSRRYTHPKTILRTINTNLLLFHTLFILHRLILLSPPNIFSLLNLSLGTPADAIRSLLLVASEDGTLPEQIERLLKRLASAEMRVLYVKFGHEALSTCDFCWTFFDFALYTGTGVVLEYLREAAILGLITIRSTSLERYRSFAIGLLVTVAAGEAYWISTVGISIPRDGREPNPVMLLFLFLPLTIHFLLPPSPPPITQDVLNTYNPNNPSAAKTDEVELPPALTIMHDLVNRVQLIRLARAALNKILPLCGLERGSRVCGYGKMKRCEQSRNDWAWVMIWVGKGKGQEGEDRDQEGPGQIGELRARARRAVGTLFRGFVPSGYWKIPPPAPAPSQG